MDQVLMKGDIRYFDTKWYFAGLINQNQPDLIDWPYICMVIIELNCEISKVINRFNLMTIKL